MEISLREVKAMDERNDMSRKYVATRLPDKLKLAAYIKEAKGPGRTMAEFAEQCGTLTASSFSRIIHGNLAKSLSAEIIQSIVKNAAPGARVDYESMMQANGMVPEDQGKQPSEEATYWEVLERRNKDLQVRNILADEHLARGHMIQYFPRLFEDLSLDGSNPVPNHIPKSRFGLIVPSSFAIRIQGYEPLYWNYVVNLTALDNRGGRPKVLPGFRAYHSFFLRDAWEPETLKDVMQTFVFVERTAYEVFLSMLSGVKVHNYVSALLVDMDAGRVVEESFLERYDGKQMKSIFLEKRMEEYQ